MSAVRIIAESWPVANVTPGHYTAESVAEGLAGAPADAWLDIVDGSSALDDALDAIGVVVRREERSEPRRLPLPRPESPERDQPLVIVRYWGTVS